MLIPKPSTIYGTAHILSRAFHGDDLRSLAGELLERIGQDSRDAAAMLDLSIIYQLHGHLSAALELQWQAVTQQPHFRLASNPEDSKLRLLVIMGPGAIMDNTPVDFLLDGSGIAMELLFVGKGLPPLQELPEHDIALVAVCESDMNQPLLLDLQEVMHGWPRPYLNAPSRIARLARDGFHDYVGQVPGAAVVRSLRMSRNEAAPDHAALPGFPLVIRPANSHAGQGLQKVETAEQLASYVTEQDGLEFSVASFIDYRTPADGLYRKYRVAMIDGVAYPAHLAISPRWMVHYLNAEMLSEAAHRRAEQHFMDHFEGQFAQRHGQALAALDQRLGLDYYSIDCGETPDGRLLVFEVDNGAVVHAMDPSDIFPYKPRHMQRLFEAFRQMLWRRATGEQLQKQAISEVRRAA